MRGWLPACALAHCFVIHEIGGISFRCGQRQRSLSKQVRSLVSFFALSCPFALALPRKRKTKPPTRFFLFRIGEHGWDLYSIESATRLTIRCRIRHHRRHGQGPRTAGRSNRCCRASECLFLAECVESTKHGHSLHCCVSSVLSFSASRSSMR